MPDPGSYCLQKLADNKSYHLHEWENNSTNEYIEDEKRVIEYSQHEA